MASAADIVEITQMNNDLLFYLGKFDMKKIAAVSKLCGKRMLLETADRGHIRVTLDKNEKPIDAMRSVIRTMNEA